LQGDTWPAVEAWTRDDWRQWLLEHNRYPALHQWTPAQATRYLYVDRYQYGVGLKRRETDRLTWFYLPGPQAVALHASKVPNVLYGGAAGGMKSHAARWDAYRHALAIPGFRAIVMRRELEQLRRNHLDKARSECARINAFLDTEVMRFMESTHEIVFTGHPKGQEAKIVFGHCQRVGDEEAYLGDEYDAFYPDEMSTFEQSQIVGVAGRLRSTKPGLVARLIGTSNPGGAHTLWIKRWFIDRTVERDEHPRYKPEAYAFLPAMLYDNPYLMDPDGTYTTYEDRLYAYDDERRRQLLHGDWSALAGQFFPEFSAATHVQTLEIPPGCKIERWIDWGYDPHPGVCHWVACLPNGRLYVFYEWKFNGKAARQKLVASEVARHIQRYTREDVLPLARATRVTKTIADPSMFSGDGHSGESYAETFARQGVPLRKGDNERVMGWGRLRHWFRPAPDGHPWILYHPRCAYAIRTIPGLVRDRSDADDVDTSGEDHAADCNRYGVMDRPTPTVFRTRPAVIPANSPAALIKELQKHRGVRPAGMVA
jgi:hypothetical protein